MASARPPDGAIPSNLDPDSLSLVAQSPDVAHCSSCGRFVGPYERCPHCGARITGRLAVRTAKLVSVLLATVGLTLLWWMARQGEVPGISVGEVSGTMNFAYVRLAGSIVRDISYDPVSGYLGFWLADDTGEAYVSAYRDVTSDLLEQGKVPAIGDDVSVAGTLRIREDHIALTVNVADHLELMRPEAAFRNAGELTLLDEGARVRLAGEVRGTYVPYEGLTLITLGDESGEVVIAVSEVVTTLTGNLPEAAVGEGIEVEGVVSLYRSTPQIVPASVADVEFLPAPPDPSPMPVLALSELDPQDEGEVVRVRGRVVLLEGLKGGVKAALDDGTAEITLLLWDDVHQGLAAPTAFDVGAEVEVTGKIALYEGVLEVIPRTAEAVTILVSAQLPPWVEIDELSFDDGGRVVRIRGVLGEPEGFSAGVKALLDDGSGKIVVLFWSNLYEALSPRPETGQQVEVAGVLDVFQQELELIPRSRYDWRVRPPDD